MAGGLALITDAPGRRFTTPGCEAALVIEGRSSGEGTTLGGSAGV